MQHLQPPPPPDYNSILLSIQKIDIAVSNISDKMLKLDLNSNDINEIEKTLININNDLRDIRKDIKFIDEKYHTRMVLFDENIMKMQKNFDIFIDSTKNKSDDFFNTVTSKNKIITIIVSIVTFFFLISNDNVKELILKILQEYVQQGI
jgi:predicted PurR-regulated permease PerM